MTNYILTHLGDDALLRELGTIVARDRATTALLLAHIAEVDSRKLYVAAGYSSMHAYCVGELHLSDDAAYKRITSARAARRYPALFEAVEEGRLHLSAICLLGPHLTAKNHADLIEEMTHRRRTEIEEILAHRFPPRDLPVRAFVIRPLGPAVSPQPASVPELRFEQAATQLAPGRVEWAPLRAAGNGRDESDRIPLQMDKPVPERLETESLAPGRVELTTRGDAAPSQPERFLLRLTVEKGTLEKLRYLQALLSHSVPSGDLDKVLDRALQIAIPEIEKQKVGAERASRTATRVRPARRVRGMRTSRDKAAKRYIPAQVRRAVWERDQRRCTFVSPSGKRCHETRFLEFDHIDPVARGGGSTVDGLRLRCRAHNQYEAERVFGVEFMERKRREARRVRVGSRLFD